MRCAGPILFSLALACAAPAAQATPPDEISLRDELFGISRNRVFVLRSSHDNLGAYDAETRNIALIAIDRQTGAEQEIRPVYRTSRFPDYGGDPDGLMMKLKAPALPGAVDPYAILRAAEGHPVIGRIGMSDASPPSSNPELLLPFDDGKHVFIRNPEMLKSRLVPMLNRFADTMGEYPRPGPLSARDFLTGPEGDKAHCFLDGGVIIDDDAAAVPVNLIRADCTMDEVVFGSFLMLVPASFPSVLPDPAPGRIHAPGPFFHPAARAAP
ncbi:MAG: hypothetical protein ACK5LJ_05600 [Paracoccus sp. (in: a-proteobacteria)]